MINFISYQTIIIPENKKSWLAGFIDGEGYIGITFQRKKETIRQSASRRYHPYLIITNSNQQILEEIKKIVGYGKVYTMCGRNKNQKQAFQYKLTNMKMLDVVLRLISPHLCIKQQQCALLLDFINVRKNAKIITGRGRRGCSSYTTEEEIYQKLRSLNRRGI